MREGPRSTGVPFALAACLAACATKTPAPPPVAAPAAAPAAVVPPIAANAGAIFVFHGPAADGSERPASLEMQAMQPQLREMFGVDVSDGADLARLGVDPTRPIVLSWAIVAPAELAAVLAAPRLPARDAPFVIRFLLVLPVTDAAASAAKLAERPLHDSCASAAGDGQRWAALRARLTTPDDRRAAEDRSAAYVCRGDVTASLARFDGARRELIWSSAFGDGSLLAAAAARPAVDAALAARLQRAGFFAARAAFYTTPADEARAYMAIGVPKMRAGAGGVEEGELRDQLWRKGMSELRAHSRLVDSDPRLFADLLATDGEMSWTLTPEGRTFFSSLGLTPDADAARLTALVGRQLKPVGLFADRKALVEAVHEAGNGAFLLIGHFLWPHFVAFAAAHPKGMPPSSPWTDGGARVELDNAAGVLRVRASAAK